MDAIGEDVVFLVGVAQWSRWSGLGNLGNFGIVQELLFSFIEFVVVAGFTLASSTFSGGSSSRCVVVVLLETSAELK